MFYKKMQFIDYLTDSSNKNIKFKFNVDTKKNHNKFHYTKSLIKTSDLNYITSQSRYFFVTINFNEWSDEFDISLIHKINRFNKKPLKIYKKNIFYFNKSNFNDKCDLFFYVNKKIKLKTQVIVNYYFFN